MVTDQEIRRRLKMTDDELLIELGTAVGLFEAPPPAELAKQEAQRWLQSSRDRLARLVCTQTVRRAIRGDEIALVKAVATLLGEDGLGQAALIAVLLIRSGIKRLCDWP